MSRTLGDASLSHVFSTSMTHEAVFGYTFIGFPNVFENPDAVDRNKVGYNYKGLFKNGVLQIPNMTGSGETAPCLPRKLRTTNL